MLSLGQWVESLFNQPVLRLAPENLLESVQNRWLMRSEENFWGSTCPKAVCTLSGFGVPGVASLLPPLLPVILIQPCHGCRGDAACHPCSTRSVVDTEGPCPASQLPSLPWLHSITSQ